MDTNVPRGESKSECYICYKLFNNSAQRNYCLRAHPVCISCLNRWLYRLHNYFCPVCRGNLRLFELSIRYRRKFRKFARGVETIRYLYNLENYELALAEEGIDIIQYLFWQ